MKKLILPVCLALAGGGVTLLQAQDQLPIQFGDTRYLLPPGQTPLEPPTSGRVYRPTPKQVQLPEARFVMDGEVAVSAHSAFKVRMGPRLNGPDAITIVSPDGKILRGIPVGLSLFDPLTGTNVLLAELKADHRRLVASNKVTYLDCWDDIAGDIEYVLNRRKFAQHVVIKGALPDPAKLGMDPKTTRLQVWTELVPSEEPVRQIQVLKEVAESVQMLDETLAFGKAAMTPGRAFLVGGVSNEVNAVNSPVAKRYMQYGQPGETGARTFLIEEMEYLPLAPALEKLPAVRKDGAAVSPATSLNSGKTRMVAQSGAKLTFPVRDQRLMAAARAATPVSVAGLASVSLLIDYEYTYYDYYDNDSDNLPDQWELLWYDWYEDIYTYDAEGDPDGDNVENQYELEAGTHPFMSDTDGDGINDYYDASPLVPTNITDTVWIEDINSIPTNTLEGTWTWFDTGNRPKPVTGTEGHISVNNYSTNENTHGFVGHPTPMGVATGDCLVVYLYIPADQAPQEILIQWHVDDTTGWNHRAYLGTQLLNYATNAYQIGAFPDMGRWIRVEVPSSQVDLEGKWVDGMRFTVVGQDSGSSFPGGEVLWDHIGVKHGTTDSDADGLPDWQEMQLGTDLYFPDSDYDGRSDAQEVAESTDPLDAASYSPQRLGYWKFNTSAFVGEAGQTPTYINYVSAVASWSSNALSTTGNNYSGIRYREMETNGLANINCRNGTVRFWFKPNWSSTTAGGSGPGTYSRFIEVGYYANPPVGHWVLLTNPNGTQLSFGSMSTNSAQYTSYGATIYWLSNQWHQVTLTYATNSSAIYVDGQLIGSGAGTQYYPISTIRAQGMRVGYDYYGAWSNGQYEELETFNYPLTSTTISNDFGAVDVDGDGLTNAEEIALGTNWNLADTDGDGVDDRLEHIRGRNPLAAGTVGDTNNVVNLEVFTPMK